MKTKTFHIAASVTMHVCVCQHCRDALSLGLLAIALVRGRCLLVRLLYIFRECWLNEVGWWMPEGSLCYEELEKLVVWQLEARYAVIDAALAVDNELERCFVLSYGLLNRCIITLEIVGSALMHRRNCRSW